MYTYLFFVLLLFSIESHSFINQEEIIDLGKCTYKADLEDADRTLNLPVDSAIQFLTTPRVDVSVYAPSLIKKAQDCVLEYTYRGHSCVFSPWETLRSMAMCKLEDNPDSFPFIEVFALAYIRGIPEWQRVYERMSTHVITNEMKNINLD